MLKRIIIGIEHRPGHVHFASPNFHLIIKRGEVKPIPAKGERNTPGDRPNVQVCRNSYSERVIEVLLTGNLNDETAGFGGQAAAEAQERLNIMLDELGPSLLPSIPKEYLQGTRALSQRRKPQPPPARL